MVTVSEIYPENADGSAAISDWLNRINVQREPKQMKLLSDSVALCLQQQQNHHVPLGESVLEFGFAVAETLTLLNMDTDTLCAAILYPSVQFGEITLKQVSNQISKTIAKIIKGVIGMEAIRSLQSENVTQSLSSEELDKLRQMLLAMVDDSRVVVVKLAIRVQNLRLAKDALDEVKLTLARETQDIYAPLANRLGVGQLKWEMEDLSFRYMHPEHYKQIAKKLAERRIDREQYISGVIKTLDKELEKVKIKGEIAGRAKHIYSIWKKMQRKGVSFEEIYDARAVRILVGEIADCYSVLGIVHGLWKHIPMEFDDYIATPKNNGYQSIHTAVIGPDGKALEVQIRTYKMHQESEHGVAAHWRYKEGGGQSSGDLAAEQKIAWLRELMEWQEGVATSGELLQQFHQTVVEDRVYVFTPNGRVIDLPPGATALDFAYSVHTDIGHSCIGARVNGKLVPLTQPLETGQTIEIMTRKNSTPSRDWLDVNQGYLKSSRSRQKVNQWFRKQNRDINIEAGRPMLIKELQRNGLSEIDLMPIAEKFNLKSINDLYASVGMGDLGINQVTNVALNFFKVKPRVESEILKISSSRSGSNSDQVTVSGVGNLLCHMAGCCKPVSGDPIIGYVTRGRGVAVHRQDCSYMMKAKQEQSDRLLEMEWSDNSRAYFEVDLFIRAIDRTGLLQDLTQLLGNAKINVINLLTHVNKRLDETEITIRIEVTDNTSLEKIISEISHLANVIQVIRQI
ncbi:MAG TPA: GTP diphosphokinase [Aeromonadales bacterium]|nr:GTP diphosphokinase [Aeromonadales bacterium]